MALQNEYNWATSKAWEELKVGNYDGYKVLMNRKIDGNRFFAYCHVYNHKHDGKVFKLASIHYRMNGAELPRNFFSYESDYKSESRVVSDVCEAACDRNNLVMWRF